MEVYSAHHWEREGNQRTAVLVGMEKEDQEKDDDDEPVTR
jgi:hypothetical protein